MKRFFARAVFALFVFTLMTAPTALADVAPVFSDDVSLRKGDAPTAFRVYESDAVIAGHEGEPVYRIEATSADGATMPTPLHFVCFETDGLAPMLRFIDLNADGWLDIEALCALGASNISCTYFIHAGETAVSDGFYEAEALSALSSYDVYPRQRLILSYAHDSAATGVYSLFRWLEGDPQPALFREAIIDWAEDGDWVTHRERVVEYGASGAETVLMDVTRPVAESGEEWSARQAEWMAALFTGLDATEPPLARTLYIVPGDAVYHADALCPAIPPDARDALEAVDRCRLNGAAFAGMGACGVCCSGE